MPPFLLQSHMLGVQKMGAFFKGLKPPSFPTTPWVHQHIITCRTRHGRITYTPPYTISHAFTNTSVREINPMKQPKPALKVNSTLLGMKSGSVVVRLISSDGCF